MRLAIVVCIFCAVIAPWPPLIAHALGRGAPPPDFSSYDVSWEGVGNEFIAPSSGPGPVRSDPAHPYISNQDLFKTGRQPTFRVAALDNPNLKP